MKWTLSDYANLAQIVSIPLTIAVWFFTREHFVKFWKSFSWLFWILVSALIVLTVWRFGWLDWVSAIVNSLTARVATPVWCLILLVAFGMILVVAIQMIARSYKNPTIRVQRPLHTMQAPQPEPTQVQEKQPPDWRNYVTDEIFGVEWQWRYLGNRLDEVLGAFCPNKNCKCRLEDQPNENTNRRSYYYSFPISLVCPYCGFRRDFDFALEELNRKVLIEVERRLRTGEFANRLVN